MVGQRCCHSRAGTSQPGCSPQHPPSATASKIQGNSTVGCSQHKPCIPGGTQMPDSRSSPSRPLPGVTPASSARCSQSSCPTCTHPGCYPGAAPLLLHVLPFLALLPGTFQTAAAHHHHLPKGRQEPCAVLLLP